MHLNLPYYQTVGHYYCLMDMQIWETSSKLDLKLT